MTVASDPIALLSRALDQTGALVARVRPDQARLPTPCRAWDVRALINHVVHDVQQFTMMARGGQWAAQDTDVIGDDWAGAYRQAAIALLAAWQQEGALDGTVQLPVGEVSGEWRVSQQIADLAVHGWDIARATGQATNLDPELAQVSLAWARQNLQPQFRGAEGSGRAFGAEVVVPEDAPVYDRLAGFFGRDPR
ncbi:MAG: TIGR03086 family metal-binding protein [Chloroflexota bacterium]|nr:TIGR03086 family metal-binding protein [Chloroflexota bacterium]